MPSRRTERAAELGRHPRRRRRHRRRERRPATLDERANRRRSRSCRRPTDARRRGELERRSCSTGSGSPGRGAVVPAGCRSGEGADTTPAETIAAAPERPAPEPRERRAIERASSRTTARREPSFARCAPGAGAPRIQGRSRRRRSARQAAKACRRSGSAIGGIAAWLLVRCSDLPSPLPLSCSQTAVSLARFAT